jgi:hypothetical protein
MGQSRERVTNVLYITVDLLVAAATITRVAGALVVRYVVEKGASILYARRYRRTTVATPRGSSETEPLAAED